MSLITLEDIQNALNLKKYGFLGKSIAWTIMKVLKLGHINKFCTENKNLPTYEFLIEVLKHLKINYEIHEEDLKRIPEKGPFIIVSNHPLGGLDGIILMKIVSEIRPDFKIMTNFLLKKIEPLKNVSIPVNPFETRKDTFDSKIGFIETLRVLKDNHCIIVFPAGEVSHYYPKTKKYEDREWVESALKLIKKARVVSYFTEYLIFTPIYKLRCYQGNW